MTKRMLIDASHAEETRVVVLDGNRLEDFDVETASRRQLKGNIYLAKVVRVEPSLQAAFVEYGGNRHGFLAFGEIHPDYYQIPVADRQRLLAMQEEEARAEEEAEDEDAPAAPPPERVLEVADEPAPQTDAQSEPAPGVDLASEPAEADQPEDSSGRVRQIEGEAPAPEASGSEAEDPRPARSASRFMRSYKIQEVIRRRQILLIQVVKEERGTKGAALTTYISLAGRYCVLMPNSPRGGGISRKITSASDRRRLKEVTAELDIPRGMGLIVRTAGAMRPKPEIKRDGEYLLRLWDDIREKTMASMAPALIHEEATLIKRVIRDVYARDVDELLIDGEDGWRAAREFMRMIMPTHVKKVQLWPQGGQPLFAHQQVESMLDSMLNPTVQLRSGGYLVINQTEALVAIDVNSGRSTRERGIEETALRTNLEAAEETARQLRLRDLAGLVVIDFIDMESKKHNAMVERRMAESLKNDRARIQIGHISHFGLMELSRQRLRPSLAETSLTICENCNGTGHVRSTESAALHVLREIEEEGGRLRSAEILVHVAPATAIYILNNKRARLGEIEQRYRMVICFAPDEALQASQTRIDKIRAQAAQDVPVLAAPVLQQIEDDLAAPDEEHEDLAPGEQQSASQPSQVRDPASDSDARPGETAEEGEQRRRRRRRRRRGGRRDEPSMETAPLPLDAEQPDIAHPQTAFPVPAEPASATEPTPAELPLDVAIAIKDGAIKDGAIKDGAIKDGAIKDEAAEPAAEPGTHASPVPGHDEASEAMAESAAASSAEPEAEADPGASPAKRSRRGGRRRRKPDAEANAAESQDDATAPSFAQTPAPAPVYAGPTPADPFAFGGQDIFDLMDAPKPTAPEPPVPEPPVPKRPAPEPPAPQLLAPQLLAPPPPSPKPRALRAPRRAKAAPAAAAEPPIPEPLAAPAEDLMPPPPATETPAAETPAVETPAVETATEPVASSAVQPVLIGAGEAAAEKKRGWWRR